MTSPKRHHRKGFTLLEMVIVLAMLAVVVFVMLSFNTGLVGRIRDISLEVKKGREGPAIMRLIESDLISAYADPRMEKIFEATSGRGSTEVRFVTSRDSVMFVNGFQSDLTETGYKISRSSRSRGSGDLYTLWRREDFSMDAEPLEGGLWIPVADNVVDFQLGFYDLPEEGLAEDRETLADLVLGGGEVEELDQWNAEDKRYLPYAVKITLVLDIREGEARQNLDMEREGIQRFVGFVRLPPFSRTMPLQEDRVNLALNPIPAPPTNNSSGGGN